MLRGGDLAIVPWGGVCPPGMSGSSAPAVMGTTCVASALSLLLGWRLDRHTCKGHSLEEGSGAEADVCLKCLGLAVEVVAKSMGRVSQRACAVHRRMGKEPRMQAFYVVLYAYQ